MRSLSRAGLLATMVLVAGCSSTRPAETRTSRDRNVLTYEELQSHRFNDLYSAIEALRSNWLVPRGTDSFLTPSQIQVIYDDTHLGDVSTLRGISIQSIVYVRYYSGVEATGRWGLDHGSGVIFVSSRDTNPREATPPRDTSTTLEP